MSHEKEGTRATARPFDIETGKRRRRKRWAEKDDESKKP